MSDLETPREGGRFGNISGYRKRLLFVGLVGLILVGVALSRWMRSTPAPRECPLALALGIDVDEEFDQLLAVVNPGYVGINVCAECHTQRAAVVKTSRHFLACRTAADGVAAPGFTPGQGRLTTHVPGLHFEMTRTGGDFLVSRVQSTPKGEKRLSFQIALVYGSAAKHDEMYFAWRDDRLYSLPVGWLYPLKRWGSHDIHGNQAFGAPAQCIACHNTWVAHYPGSINRYRKSDMLLGVTCERCHGPGREHVEHHRANPKASEAHAILHPGTLSRERLMDVCAQCHVKHKTFGQVFAYRPGQKLEDYAHIPKPINPEDDSTNQVNYLKESKCFQKSEMTCISCHNPHRPGSAQSACLNCHKPVDCRDRPRLPTAVQGDCVGCHMPPRIRMHFHYYTTADDRYVPLATRAEHRIAVYSEARASVLLAWHRLQNDPQNRTEADRLAGQLTRYWVEEAARRMQAGRFKGAMGAYREALKIAPDPTIRRRLDEVMARQAKLDDLTLEVGNSTGAGAKLPLLKNLLELKPDSAFAHRELGMINLMMGQREQAVRHLNEVARCDPGDAFGLIALANLAYRNGRLEEAATLCAKARDIAPAESEPYHLWGLILLKQQRWAESEHMFRNALIGNPTSAESNRGLSESLRHQGRAAEAIRFARRAIRCNESPKAELLVTLAEALVAANRLVEAREQFDQALHDAMVNDPELVPIIRSRLDELQ